MRERESERERERGRGIIEDKDREENKMQFCKRCKMCKGTEKSDLILNMFFL